MDFSPLFFYAFQFNSDLTRVMFCPFSLFPSHSYIVLSVLVVYVYYTQGLRLNDESFGGAKELLQEGFMSSFALFLVTWIIVYNLLWTNAS
jgi:uncharacterized membrane protein AbrB (regulator of aidB expression)